MFLLQMAGFPGSGKSTIAKQIAKNINCIVLDRDIIKNSMMNSGIEGQVLADASYLVVFDLASYYLDNGISVIIDTPCYYKNTVDKGIEICNRYKATYKYIECIVEDFEEIDNRLKSRNRLQTQINGTTKENYYNAYDKSAKPRDTEVLVVNSTSRKDYDIETILTYLQEG